MGEALGSHRKDFEGKHLVLIKNKSEEPMLNYLEKANLDYLGHLTRIQGEVQHLLDSFNSLCEIKHFQYAMELRVYASLVEKIIDKGTLGLSAQE
jgi:hypothetical protein